MTKENRLWSNTKTTNAEVYVSNNKCLITKEEENFQWKALSLGPVTLQIHPFDTHYSLEWYFLAVYGCNFPYNSFCISVNISDPSNKTLNKLFSSYIRSK